MTGVQALKRAVHEALSRQGAVPRYVGPKLGSVESSDGKSIDVEVTLEAAPSVLFDAMVLPDGDAAVEMLAAVGHTAEFVKDQYRHCKAILALGDGARLLQAAGIPAPSGDDGALVVVPEAKAAPGLKSFVAALASHRNWDRATDPPKV